MMKNRPVFLRVIFLRLIGDGFRFLSGDRLFALRRGADFLTEARPLSELALRMGLGNSRMGARPDGRRVALERY